MDLSSLDFLPLGEDTEILPFDCNDADLNNFLLGKYDFRVVDKSVA